MQPQPISNSRKLIVVFAVLIILVGLVLTLIVANSSAPTSYQMTASAVINTNIRPVGYSYETATAAAQFWATFSVETQPAQEHD